MTCDRVIVAALAVLFADNAFSAVDRREPALIPAPRKMVLSTATTACTNIVYLSDSSLPPEGYRLMVRTNGIVVTSSTEAGAFYAGVTLSQLKDGGRCPCVEIEDAPAFRWRGVHVDESRHFFGKVTIKRVLDMMSAHKLNVFHWHLTDDQGWRLAIPGYPELLKYAAVRPSSPLPGGWKKTTADGDVICEQDNMRYGPYYYTEEDLREIVDYAAARYITVVPEIEFPGHIAAALAAYPQFACRPENVAHRHPRLAWGISKDVLCLGSDEALRFVEAVLDYVCSIFPGPYVHIGGDECPRDRWKSCPRCQRRMLEEKLSDEGALQTWATSRFVRFLADRGKRTVGWDEYLNGEIPPSAIGMSWRASKKDGEIVPLVSACEAAERGHDLIMATSDYAYFCLGQGLDNDPFEGRDLGRLTLEKVFSFDLLKNVPECLQSRILGGQCCLWSEETSSPPVLEWKMWPRACAMAEVLWLGKNRKGFDDFRMRMKMHRKRLIAAFVNCAPIE